MQLISRQMTKFGRNTDDTCNDANNSSSNSYQMKSKSFQGAVLPTAPNTLHYSPPGTLVLGNWFHVKLYHDVVISG